MLIFDTPVVTLVDSNSNGLLELEFPPFKDVGFDFVEEKGVEDNGTVGVSRTLLLFDGVLKFEASEVTS